MGLKKYSGLPFVIGQQSGAVPRSVDQPLPTIATDGAISLVQPFLVMMYSANDARPVDLPLPTVTAQGNYVGLAQPFILPFEGVHRGNAPRSIDDPLPTITSRGGGCLVQPFIVEYHGNGNTHSLDEPLSTQTTKDRFGLVQPLMFQIDSQTYMLDVRFRMLLPHELSAAMSFPKQYVFAGTREAKVRQIGNAVPVLTAEALMTEILKRYRAAN